LLFYFKWNEVSRNPKKQTTVQKTTADKGQKSHFFYQRNHTVQTEKLILTDRKNNIKL